MVFAGIVTCRVAGAVTTGGFSRTRCGASAIAGGTGCGCGRAGVGDGTGVGATLSAVALDGIMGFGCFFAGALGAGAAFWFFSLAASGV
jgi:hypothetical protein